MTGLPQPNAAAGVGVLDAGDRPLSAAGALVVAAVAVGSFHAAFGLSGPWFSWLVMVYLGGLVVLRRVRSARWAFYGGLGVGVGVFAPQLGFFWEIFGPAGAMLWLVLAFWHAVFLLILHEAQRHWGTRVAVMLAPVCWLGIEYFRSELYYLRFSWLTAGYVMPPEVARPLWWAVGVYGTGAVLMALSAVVVGWLEAPRWIPGAVAAGIGVLVLAGYGGARVLWKANCRPDGTMARVGAAGVQMEFPSTGEVLEALDGLAAAYPGAEVLLLSEYTFDGPVPEEAKDWCRRRGRHLVAGGKEPVPGPHGFENTAYVIDREGRVVFKQVKAVPIQFFRDGRAASEQRLWDSPWGRAGVLVCYDLSYTRVVDRLVTLGAQVLIAPSMDAVHWGRRQHELNARNTIIRASEYGIPVLRVASSGYSQFVERDGGVVVAAGFPGAGERLGASLCWNGRADRHKPLDRWAAWGGVMGTAGVGVMLVGISWREGRRRSRPRVEIPEASADRADE
ncbi:MAG TPA: nitrilase-related carbon-nitrogen hydrolase [Verrucomicrobiota bacterium]|nr:nitrilase-related carbon-nitrogen hydrolase [Verrucomicrobiota bacterium]HNU51237.1 nitrilase-related carbon-nitrogen hydrolase [Verrucomicrobiota bacterium]